jgi:class 3 adenylate cyclase
MQEKMVDLRKKWKNEGFYNPFEIRIGLNTGYCNVGNFGSSQRLTYTIIGGEVNVAARLEAAGDAGGILMSYETYAHVQDMVEVEEKESVKMKGINREIKVFSVLKRRTSKQRKKIVSSKDKTNKASYDHKIKEIKNDLFSLQKKIDLLTKEKGN